MGSSFCTSIRIVSISKHDQIMSIYVLYIVSLEVVP